MSAARILVHGLDRRTFGPALDPAVLTGLSLRALVLAGPDDLVVAEREPDPTFLDWLATHGRGPGRVVVPAPGEGGLVSRLAADERALAVLADHGGRLDPYASGPEERALAGRLGLTLHGCADDLAERINHKAVLGEWLARADLPDLPTRVVPRDGTAEAAAAALAEGPVIVRADVGIAGLGVWIVRGPDELTGLPAALGAYAADDLFLVQPLLPTRSSPNVQYDLDELGPSLVGASEQRLADGIHHTGNGFPLRDPAASEVLRQGHALAYTLWDAGYRGFLGVDFVVTTLGGVVAIEVNPRLNTSSFGLLTLAERALDGDPPGALISLSAVPVPGVEDFAGFRERLGDGALLTPDGAAGLFPILPPLPGRPRADFAVLAADAEAAEEATNAVLARLARSEVRR